MSIYDLPFIINIEYIKAMTPANITNGFKKCGIYPLDRDDFSKEDFAPSDVTDREFIPHITGDMPDITTTTTEFNSGDTAVEINTGNVQYDRTV